jgi:hypothetical protein
MSIGGGANFLLKISYFSEEIVSKGDSLPHFCDLKHVLVVSSK